MFSGTGLDKPGKKFVKQTFFQNTVNSQNTAANHRWKTGAANATLCIYWLCNEIGHRAVHCKKRKTTQFSSSQEKRSANGKATAVNNVKAEQMQCNRVIIESIITSLVPI